ncbi:NDP-hexose 2,3-dehydratase family protein [Geomonas subterranea]|uniref:NDP-hexose 2,3-dehydratase family protein n=1 Tax=Geomonas subterranea TaxID=2847989 RepID=A0ABX8LAS4_9BACT|nr:MULTISPECIES: NDP-hexose 2,3-dehydratase family protein [Geomonas]QXE89076.1 NDP-hexose 2,3-dehydratase family protein [Geomonas subterranea]QXM08806.1 NDP-hexose 2,3-dehydratase family protein [Geomonas subterranea]
MAANMSAAILAAGVTLSPGHAAGVAGSRSGGFALHDDAFVDRWVAASRERCSLCNMQVPLDAVQGWHREPASGNIRHDSGRFFSVMGVHVRHRVRHHQLEWDQPIIEQPEIGILGILAKYIDGTLHFCLQAKEEPGNVGGVQLSPTVQATYSNYTRAHGGGRPLFIERFIEPDPARRLFARLQTEDGGRFLYKSNRNMIIVAGDEVPVELPEGFIWLTLRQIATLIRRDNLVNACTRSILACLVSDGSAGGTVSTAGREGLRDTLQWLDDCRAVTHMLTRRIGLHDLTEWRLDEKGYFSHVSGAFFRIVGLTVSSQTREVGSWGQPIIENPAPGIIGLLLREGPDGTELLMQAKAEAGNRTTVQLAPTAQFTQGNYEGNQKLEKPFLFGEFSAPGRFPLVHESRQAEEGARFYREYNLHRILRLPEGVELALPPDYRWLTMQQVLVLVHLGEQVNSCARSIISCLL